MKAYEGKLIIFTTFYNRQTISDYASSLYKTALVLERLGIDQDYWCSEGGFHVEMAMDEVLTKFAESDATDLLVIDSDESWSPESIVALLRHPEPIVCGTYRKKNAWIEYIGDIKKDKDNYPIGKLTSETTAIIEADRVPAGFLRIKKEVVQKYIAVHSEDYYYINGRKTYSFFMNEIKNHQWTGMDFCFCDKLKELGYKLWIDPNLDINHFGLIEHKGNFDKHLKGNQAIEVVKNMAKELNGKRGI